MTMPPLLCAAVAMDSDSRVSASRSMVRLPSGSAVVARMMATWIGKVSVQPFHLDQDSRP
jgi:hypothetical protein